MQATDGDRVVELPPDVVLEVARAYAEQTARDPFTLLTKGPWVMRTLLDLSQQDVPFAKEGLGPRPPDPNAPLVWRPEDFYGYRLIAEQFGLERTLDHKTWLRLVEALQKEVSSLFQNVRERHSDKTEKEHAIRAKHISRMFGRMICRKPFDSGMTLLLAYVDAPLLLQTIALHADASAFNWVGKNGMTPLFCAISANQLLNLKRLLQYGADVEEGYYDLTHKGMRASPLIFAASRGRREATRILLAAGADAWRYTTNGLRLRASQVAGMNKHHDVEKILRGHERGVPQA